MKTQSELPNRIALFWWRVFEDHIDDGFPWPQILFVGAVCLIALSRLYPNYDV